MHSMTSHTLQNSISVIVDNIANQGYAVIEHFLNHQEIQALAMQANFLQSTGEMHNATTGVAKIQSPSIRGDVIHWLEASQASDAERVYLESMSALQQALNQAFFLGLFELESHFAIYPLGAGYQKHLDQFIGKEERKISCILYLNENWKSEDGGQLRMYLDKKNEMDFIDIPPQGGTLVVFLSNDFLHEVLPANRQRMSITGWFRTRGMPV